jgi:tetratricopeptide (TPR) repeat protein
MFSGARLRKISVYAGIFSLFIFVAGNILQSQTINHLYFRLIEGDREAIAPYLTQIRQLPVFQSELIRYKNSEGAWVERKVFQKEWERNSRIVRLEEALKMNPASRDILFGLARLYEERGDTDKASRYREAAKQIDPGLK